VGENWVLRRMSGPKREERTLGVGHLHLGGVHDLCSMSSMIKMTRQEEGMGRECSIHENRMHTDY
jgi:hypothetical protein